MEPEIPLRRLLEPVSHELEIRKSRFLAQAVHLPSLEVAGELIAGLATASASHNCWAWRHGGQYRFTDDGEPGGTAGRPILTAIEQKGLDQCLVVVTRWYGGIQLGTGGLARAYGGCAAKCLQGAVTEPLIERSGQECLCPYSLLEQFKALLNSADAYIMSECFLAEGVHLQMAIPLDRQHSLQQALQNLSRGAVSLQHIGH